MCARKYKDILGNLQTFSFDVWQSDVQGCRPSNNPGNNGGGSDNERGVIGCIHLQPGIIIPGKPQHPAISLVE